MVSIRSRIMYTGTDIKSDALLTFDSGRIKSVSAARDRRADMEFDVITPAFIDPHAHIGMIRAGEPRDESEANEQMETILPIADALDSVQMDDPAFVDSVEAGILYSCVVPGSGNIVGGRAAIIRNFGEDTNSALIGRAGIKAAIGYNPMSTRNWKGTRPYTRMGGISLLRGRLYDVKEAMKKSGEAAKTVSAEDLIFRSILKGRETLRVHVHKVDDIAALIRLVDEFRLKVIVEHSADVNDHRIYRELQSRSIPVVYGPVDAFAYKVELKHASWRNIAHLIDSGVQFGLMTDHPVVLQSMLLYQLRWFLRHGISKSQAIGIITRDNAKILGIDDNLGTLEPRKWASFICWNGDPFDLTSFPVAAFGEGTELLQK